MSCASATRRATTAMSSPSPLLLLLLLYLSMACVAAVWATPLDMVRQRGGGVFSYQVYPDMFFYSNLKVTLHQSDGRQALSVWTAEMQNATLTLLRAIEKNVTEGLGNAYANLARVEPCPDQTSGPKCYNAVVVAFLRISATRDCKYVDMLCCPLYWYSDTQDANASLVDVDPASLFWNETRVINGFYANFARVPTAQECFDNRASSDGSHERRLIAMDLDGTWKQVQAIATYTLYEFAVGRLDELNSTYTPPKMMTGQQTWAATATTTTSAASSDEESAATPRAKADPYVVSKSLQLLTLQPQDRLVGWMVARQSLPVAVPIVVSVVLLVAIVLVVGCGVSLQCKKRQQILRLYMSLKLRHRSLRSLAVADSGAYYSHTRRVSRSAPGSRRNSQASMQRQASTRSRSYADNDDYDGSADCSEGNFSRRPSTGSMYSGAPQMHPQASMRSYSAPPTPAPHYGQPPPMQRQGSFNAPLPQMQRQGSFTGPTSLQGSFSGALQRQGSINAPLPAQGSFTGSLQRQGSFSAPVPLLGSFAVPPQPPSVIQLPKHQQPVLELQALPPQPPQPTIQRRTSFRSQTMLQQPTLQQRNGLPMQQIPQSQPEMTPMADRALGGGSGVNDGPPSVPVQRKVSFLQQPSETTAAAANAAVARSQADMKAMPAGGGGAGAYNRQMRPPAQRMSAPMNVRNIGNRNPLQC